MQVIEPIQSRCAIVRYARLADQEILQRLLHVARTEQACPLLCMSLGAKNEGRTYFLGAGLTCRGALAAQSSHAHTLPGAGTCAACPAIWLCIQQL